MMSKPGSHSPAPMLALLGAASVFDSGLQGDQEQSRTRSDGATDCCLIFQTFGSNLEHLNTQTEEHDAAPEK